MARGRFVPWQAVMLLLLALLAGCATTGGGKDVAVGEQIAVQALAMTGKPYRYGGSGPTAFDCSGLVHYAHRQVGIQVPRTTAQQYRHAKRVPRSDLRAGDLVFFRIQGKLSHVGLYTGDGRFVHAPSSGRSVSIAHLDNPYWRKRLVGAGRLY